MSFINEDGRPWHLVQLPEARGQMVPESFKELHRRRHYDWRHPQFRHSPQVEVFEVRLVVMFRDNLQLVLSWQH